LEGVTSSKVSTISTKIVQDYDDYSRGHARSRTAFGLHLENKSRVRKGESKMQFSQSKGVIVCAYVMCVASQAGAAVYIFLDLYMHSRYRYILRCL